MITNSCLLLSGYCCVSVLDVGGDSLCGFGLSTEPKHRGDTVVSTECESVDSGYLYNGIKFLCCSEAALKIYE